MQVETPNKARTPRRWLGAVRIVTLTGVTVLLLIVLVARLHTAQHLVGGSPRSPAQGHPAPDFTLHTWAWWDALATPRSQSAQVVASETRHLAALKGTPSSSTFGLHGATPVARRRLSCKRRGSTTKPRAYSSSVWTSTTRSRIAPRF